MKGTTRIFSQCVFSAACLLLLAGCVRPPQSQTPPSDVVGLWQYDDLLVWVEIAGDGSAYQCRIHPEGSVSASAGTWASPDLIHWDFGMWGTNRLAGGGDEITLEGIWGTDSYQRRDGSMDDRCSEHTGEDRSPFLPDSAHIRTLVAIASVTGQAQACELEWEWFVDAYLQVEEEHLAGHDEAEQRLYMITTIMSAIRKRDHYYYQDQPCPQDRREYLRSRMDEALRAVQLRGHD